MDKRKERERRLFSTNDGVELMGQWSGTGVTIISGDLIIQKTATIILETQPRDFIASLAVDFPFTLNI